MTDRVLITPQAIKVSLPGFDVNTADIEDLAFHSDFAMLGQVISGYVDLPNPVPIPGGAVYTTPVTVNFGRTFDGPPIFLFGMFNLGNLYVEYVRDYAPDPPGGFPARFASLSAKVSNSDVVIIPHTGGQIPSTIKYKALI